MFRYRKKPVEIEAVELPRGWTAVAGPQWFRDAYRAGTIYLQVEGDALRWYVKTREGLMRAEPGAFLIRGVQGELYPASRRSSTRPTSR